MRIKAIVTILITAITAFGIMDSFTGLAALNSLQANGNLGPLPPSLWMGNGEDYLLTLSYLPPVPNYTQAWQNLIHNTSGYSAKYNWKVYRLAFTFPDLYSASAVDSQLNLTKMDQAIAILASHGYKVILSDFDWAGFGSHAWVQDWIGVAEHYKGDIRIAAFEIFNEPTSTAWSANVTTQLYSSSSGVESAYVNCTDAIRAVDSNRWVVWNPAFFQGQLYPPFVRNNVVYTWHLTSPMTATVSQQIVNQSVIFRDKYKVPIWFGEINVNLTDPAYTKYQMSLVTKTGTPYIIWLYSIYTSAWKNVL